MITIPEYLWSRMLAEFARELRTVEQVCYFDGFRVGGDGVAVAVVFPNAKLLAGRFEVSPDSMSQAGKHFRQLGMVRLAQVHTHPESWVGHSHWDDERAYSQLPGAMSIVLPHHARQVPALADAGIHLRAPTGWQQLSRQELDAHVRLVPSILDFRLQEEKHAGTNLKQARKRPWWSILAFWRH